MVNTMDVTIQLERDIKEQYDPFFSENNRIELERRIADIEAGKNITPHEIIEIEDGKSMA